MTGEQGCLFCGWSGIDEENSYPAEGPSYYSMGEPPHIEPCICQYSNQAVELSSEGMYINGRLYLNLSSLDTDW